MQTNEHDSKSIMYPIIYTHTIVYKRNVSKLASKLWMNGIIKFSQDNVFVQVTWCVSREHEIETLVGKYEVVSCEILSWVSFVRMVDSDTIDTRSYRHNIQCKGCTSTPPPPPPHTHPHPPPPPPPPPHPPPQTPTQDLAAYWSIF